MEFSNNLVYTRYLNMKVKIVRGAKDIDGDRLEDYDKEYELIIKSNRYSRISDGRTEYWFENDYVIFTK
ncbi:hypothetical protein SD457_05900 [Coprobacillaceae bacterium CR2/5/TPMF4]|nr:hypothetical protein SD457_05900 [Coprobacillaceae bacterium CR2/5/TPMF4]